VCDVVGHVATVSVTSLPAGRVLRPMIVAKQLDLPEGPSGADAPAALPLPRTQLTRELEKYSRPSSATTETPVGRPHVNFTICQL